MSGLTQGFENRTKLRNKVKIAKFRIKKKFIYTQVQLGRNEEPINNHSFCEHRNRSNKRELRD